MGQVNASQQPIDYLQQRADAFDGLTHRIQARVQVFHALSSHCLELSHRVGTPGSSLDRAILSGHVMKVREVALLTPVESIVARRVTSKVLSVDTVTESRPL